MKISNASDFGIAIRNRRKELKYTHILQNIQVLVLVLYQIWREERQQQNLERPFI